MDTNNKVMILALIFTITVLSAIVVIVPNYLFPKGSTKVLKGSLFVSDAGRSHGGFEYNAEWNATLSIEGEKGTLHLVLNIGLGDALEKHEYQVTDFEIDAKKASMKIDGTEVMLVLIEKDLIWDGRFDNYYVASWGGDTSQEEIVGRISPDIFLGLGPHYYVELRLKE
ncbi:MAG: hypothetical protein ACUVQ8_04585 [Nitrososphaeria archaeon]